MKQRGSFVFATVLAYWLFATAGCKSDAVKSDDSGQAAQAATSKARTGADRNACDLLTLEEVSSAVGVTVTAEEMSSANGPPEPATEANRVRGRSDCHWVDSDRLPRLIVVGYWTGGKEGWQILAGSRVMLKGITAEGG
jgi:hypothetical protein